jgi:hypothetical protein
MARQAHAAARWPPPIVTEMTGIAIERALSRMLDAQSDLRRQKLVVLNI